MVAEVYFTDMRVGRGQNLLSKLERLWEKAGFDDIIAPRDLVAIKLHFGEKGNLAYIRPQFIRRLVDRIKIRGGKPFLTDANTLYVGTRANAVDHLQTAVENGFDYAVVGAPILIADGLNGKDYVSVPIEGKHFKEVKIGSAAVHADAFVAVTHFKGHEVTGFGGTIKNIGMGLGSRAGKQQMHSDLQPKINLSKCTGCGKCTKWCPAVAIALAEGKAAIDPGKCIGCGECTVTCPVQSIAINWRTEEADIQEKMAEYTLGVLQGKEGKMAFISFLTDISPDCDCCSWNDVPLVHDIGILASRDPIALDQACVDLVNRQRGLPGSKVEGIGEGVDKFRAVRNVDWSHQLVHGERIGLGTRKYSLIKV